MKIILKFHHCEAWEEIYLRIYFLIKKNNWSLHSIVTVVALFGGLVSPIIGILLDLIVWRTSTGNLKTYLYEGSIIFYALTLPLLGIASHTLDLLEEKLSVAITTQLQSQEFDLGLKP